MQKQVRMLLAIMLVLIAWQAVASAAAIVVVDDNHRRAFFGFYGSSRFADQPEQLWDDTVAWAVGGGTPSLTHVLLFTFDGTLSDADNANVYSIGFYNLLTLKGYQVEIDSRLDFAGRTGYGGFDLVVFPNFGYSDATAPPADNVIGAGVPFITMEPGQTDELNIGTGVTVFSGTLTQAVVVDNHHAITDYNALAGENYTIGEILVLANLGALNNPQDVPTDGIAAAGDGRVLIGLIPEPATMMLLATGILIGASRIRRRGLETSSRA